MLNFQNQTSGRHSPATVQRLSVLLAALLAGTTASAAPAVVADIAPVHSIAARVMQGVGEPVLIVPPGASPHELALRPSQARTLQQAGAIFWTGPALTPWMEKPLSALPAEAETVDLSETEGLTLLPVREGGVFEAHHHDEDEEHGHEGHSDDEVKDTDPHFWLDPQNAVAIAGTVAKTLARIDPDNAEIYRSNAAEFKTEMSRLSAEIAEQLNAANTGQFFVFHDAYQYYENRFEISASGSVAFSDADKPGAARIAEIRDRLRDGGIDCVFSEPQFEPALVVTLTEGTGIRTGSLDPVGAGLEPGPDLYPALIKQLTDSLTSCANP